MGNLRQVFIEQAVQSPFMLPIDVAPERSFMNTQQMGGFMLLQTAL